ncbi:MAG: hypothetical protein ABI330_22210 [Caldimonas sp.]
MTKVVELGSEVRLPSGRVVRITAPADNLRPWTALVRGSVWQVCRPRGRSGERGASLYYGGKPVAEELDETDARALAEILNQVKAAQYPR